MHCTRFLAVLLALAPLTVPAFAAPSDLQVQALARSLQDQGRQETLAFNSMSPRNINFEPADVQPWTPVEQTALLSANPALVAQAQNGTTDIEPWALTDAPTLDLPTTPSLLGVHEAIIEEIGALPLVLGSSAGSIVPLTENMVNAQPLDTTPWAFVDGAQLVVSQ